jgi:hypothetical protein
MLSLIGRAFPPVFEIWPSNDSIKELVGGTGLEPVTLGL